MRLTVKQLRTILQESLQEDSDVLKKWASKSSDPFEKWLVSHNLNPIPSGKKNSKLGSGAQAVAYEVEVNGKRYVAKFIQEHEVAVYQKVKSFKEELPEQFAKNILSVYDFYKVTEELYDNIGSYEDCILVEYLLPLPNNVIQSLWSPFERSDSVYLIKNRLKSFIHGSDSLKKLLIHSLKESKVKLEPRLFTELYESIVKSLSTMTSMMNGKSDDSSFQQYVKLIDEFVVQTHNATQQIAKKLPQNISSEEWKLAEGTIQSKISNALNGIIMPMNSHDDTTMFDSVVEDDKLKDLMKTLQFLSKNHNFNWNDLHSDNIMVRPGSGDYVISDPGSFF